MILEELLKTMDKDVMVKLTVVWIDNSVIPYLQQTVAELLSNPLYSKPISMIIEKTELGLYLDLIHDMKKPLLNITLVNQPINQGE